MTLSTLLKNPLYLIRISLVRFLGMIFLVFDIRSGSVRFAIRLHTKLRRDPNGT
jgi:hypothetical protein